MKALDRQLLLQLILVKYYLSSRWTPRRHLFEKSSSVPHAIWVITVSSEPPHSNPRCILSFPVTYEEGKQLCPTYNPPPPTKNFAHRIMLCASQMASAVEVPLSGENSFFPVISLGCGVVFVQGVCFAASLWCDQTIAAHLCEGKRVWFGMLIISWVTCFFFLFLPISRQSCERSSCNSYSSMVHIRRLYCTDSRVWDSTLYNHTASQLPILIVNGYCREPSGTTIRFYLWTENGFKPREEREDGDRLLRAAQKYFSCAVQYSWFTISLYHLLWHTS